MGHWSYRKSVAVAEEEDHYHRNPSFSSTLLDSIYRSIENEEHIEIATPALTTMKKKQSVRSYDVIKVTNYVREEARDNNTLKVRRATMAEQQKPSETMFSSHRRRSLPDRPPSSMFFHSTSSSSDSSSSIGGFSSSEPESGYASRTRSSSVPKIRTHANSNYDRYHGKPTQDQKSISSKHESGFVKTKALKIYKDLKKVKEPISPGGKISSFINSLFHKNNKVKRNDEQHRHRDTSTLAASTTPASSTSSSRSCLSSSKTQTSNGKLSNGVKRSVRFYPVSVIVDEDSKPCGHKSLYRDDEISTSRSVFMKNDEEVMKKKRIEEAARDLIRSYRKKEIDCGSDLMMGGDLEDDDDVSCASSDLFELDNLGSIGMVVDDELPVYETTHVKTNRAIANGFIL